MFINILKSIQRFANGSRKFKDLENVTSHCIDKLKLFVGFKILSNSETNDSNIEIDKNLSLEDYLCRPLDVEIRSILTFVEKKKCDEFDFNEYDEYLNVIYPYIISPIYKACKQYTNSKLKIIALDGIQKLVSCERFKSIFIDVSKFHGCGGLKFENNDILDGIGFLTKLLVELYESTEDDQLKIHVIKIIMSLMVINISYFDCDIFYSIILTLFNIYSNNIDIVIKNSSNSIFIQMIEFFFNCSIGQNNKYIEKYFMLLIEIIYTLSMTNNIISINKRVNGKEIEKIKLIIPFEMRIESSKFIEIENNFFKFAHNNTDLDQRVYKIRNMCLEALILVYKKYFDNTSCENNTYMSKCINKIKYVHVFCILKNTILNDSSIRINSLKLWSLSNHIDNLIGFHGIYISKCILSLFEYNLLALPEKITIINILFGKLIENEILFSFLFREYDLNLNNENLILRLFNLLTNILVEDISNKTNIKDLQETAFKLIIRILVALKNILSQFNNSKSTNNNDDVVLMKKYLMNEYLNEFNNGEYNKCIELLHNSGIIEDKSKSTIAKLLISNKYISKISIGEYLSLPDKTNGDVLREYCNLFSFKGYSLDYSLYIFLSNFHLPGEAQKIDRIIEQFSIKYYVDNIDLFPNKDSVYIIAFSLMILHTDAHNKEIKNDHRMSKQDFIKNNSELLVSSSYSIDCLETYYDNVTLNEWIFEYSRNHTTVVFPFFEYFINYISSLEILNTNNEENNEFQIKMLGHKLYEKIINLLINNNEERNNDLISCIYTKIKERYETLCFSDQFTRELIYWRTIPNSSNQLLIDNILKKNSPLNCENSQLSNPSIYYDGIKFNKISKFSHNTSSLQPSNSINQSTNSIKWSNTIKISDSRNRDVNSIFQTCILNIVISVINNNNVINENNSNYILLSKTICSYVTEMISNIDFWIYINKDFLVNWITIIKVIVEISIILNMEPCYTINMVILSYLTNIVTLPINYNQLFFSGINKNEELLNYSSEGKRMSDCFPKNVFFSESNNHFCSYSIKIKNFKLIIRALKIHLCSVKKCDYVVEDEFNTDIRKQNNDQEGCNLLTIMNGDNYQNQILLNDSNVFAIKCILEITNFYGDKFTCLIWFIVIGIISQIDRYFYVKTLQKSNEYGNINHTDLNRTTVDQGRDTKETVDFFNISKIKNINNKEQYHSSTGTQSAKSIRNIFGTTKNTLISSQLVNFNENNNKESIDNTNRKAKSSGNNSPISNFKSDQIVKSYIYLKNSIYHNNLWCNEISLEIKGEDILWVDNDIYNCFLNQFSISNLRKIDRKNSEIITYNFSNYDKLGNIFTSNIIRKGSKCLIRDFFMGLLFNAINQVLHSFKKTTKLFLFNTVFEIMGFLIESDYYDGFYDIILWDDYFLPYFYEKTIQLLDEKSIEMVLNLIDEFIFKFLNSSNKVMRNNINEKTDYSKILFISRENSLKNNFLVQNTIFKYINLDSTNSNNKGYSCFYLFKCILDSAVERYSINIYMPFIESVVNSLSKIIIQCDEIKYYNTMDFKEILEIYSNIVSLILKNTELRESNNMENQELNEKNKTKANKFMSIIHLNSYILDEEVGVLSDITASIISINHFVFIIDIDLSFIIVNTLINILKILICKNNKLVNEINHYLIYIFYLMVKNTYNADIQVLIQECNIVSDYSALKVNDNNSNACFNSDIHKVFTCCFREYLLFITKKYIIENNYTDLYYYSLTNISKIMYYWLGIAFKSNLVQDTLFVYNLICELFNTISSGSNINRDFDGCYKTSLISNKLGNNITNLENNYGFKYNSNFNGSNTKNNINEDFEDEYEEDEYDDEEDDFENYLVDDEANIDFIQYKNYNSIETDKSNFEVTNKKHQLYNSQLTLTNMSEMEGKNNVNSKSSFALLNKKIREINKILNTRNCRNQLITDEILESGFYLEIKNISSEKKNKAPKMIKVIYNLYRILDYYILRLNINIIKALFNDWLNINNRILLMIKINIFNMEDIRVQFKLFIVYFRLLNNNRKMFGYNEWKLIIEHFSELIMKFTNNILVDEKMCISFEDIDNNYYNNDYSNNTKRLSIDDLLVNYSEEKLCKGNKISGMDEYLHTKKRSNIESFFKSIFFQRKKYYSDSKRIKNYDDSDINMLRRKNVEKKLSNMRLLLKKSWRCYSHKYIKNTCDQSMYYSYNKLGENIEELINTSIKGLKEQNCGNDCDKTLNKPQCVQDLYSVLLVMNKLLLNWFFTDLKNGDDHFNCESNNDFYQEIYLVITNSLGYLHSMLIKNLNFVKYYLYKYNIYLIETIQIYTRMEFLSCFGNTNDVYVNHLIDYIKYISSECINIEDDASKYSSISIYNVMINNRKKQVNNSLSNDKSDKFVNSSIISSNKHPNYYNFNSCYDQFISNKTELKNIYCVLLYNLLNDILNVRQKENSIKFCLRFILDSPVFQKTLLDIALTGNKQLVIMSKHILKDYYDYDSTVVSIKSNKNNNSDIKTDFEDSKTEKLMQEMKN
ncbi:hypothetical protein FG386_003276 [Cryptosporidium ryanae]|uniref:uncharacterized protein n=1 Tax=Cryptosporidium ryanae TaxID=515981 RepID=UPI00351A7825|nr:hypothetical protein FG386_003276 [Cryptosporidium ryanae]